LLRKRREVFSDLVAFVPLSENSYRKKKGATCGALPFSIR
jgi:hypothetical protein